jgi:hypothetical protein
MSHRDDSTPVELPSDAALDVAELPAPGTSTLALMPGTTREIHGQVTSIATGLLDQPSYINRRTWKSRIAPGVLVELLFASRPASRSA